jgi:predicted nucleic-acid-binding protein
VGEEVTTAADTNLLVRLYTEDHPAQAAAALAALRGAAPVFVAKTVVLELFWVLTSVYQIKRPQMLEVLRNLVALDSLLLEDEQAVASAVEYYGQGLEFADAMHLVAARDYDRFLTFDDKLAKRANKLGLVPACVVPEVGS